MFLLYFYIIFFIEYGEVKLDKGGHLAVCEQPEFFTTEIRAAFKSLW